MAPFWPRVYAGEQKLAWIKTDFSKYKDEDEDDEEVNADMPDMGGMGGMGNMMNNPEMVFKR